ncbi:MAG TPA: hypothetical protein PLF03_02580 [Candidatus Omnitrophota bacterium]|nr:hypothetical protein [Candidatus Omnitrophota bacterium]
MERHLKKLPEEMQRLLYEARDTADRLGVPVFLIGGSVRDLIMDVGNFDLDIAVEGDGIGFAKDYARTLKAAWLAHKRFGTATVTVKPHLKIDVASTRRETYPAAGALPQVKAGSLIHDLARRDFTINTLALRLNRKGFGEVVDKFNGRKDIARKLIRILHDRSFIDDPTRILRGIRFEQRYGFHIEPRTLACLKAAVRRDALSSVGPQRVRDELHLLCKEKHPLKSLKRLQVLAGLHFIHPRLSLSSAKQQLLAQAERQVSWFENQLPPHRQLDTWLVYFLALLDGLSVNDVHAVCRRFVFRKGEEKRMLVYAASRTRVLQALQKKEIRPSEIYHLLEPLSFEAIIVLKAKAAGKGVQRHIELFLTQYSGTRISVSGDTLAGFGVRPGPQYQMVLRRVFDAKLNRQVHSKEEEVALARDLARKPYD